MIRLVLLRHGESTWNKKNIFTGWTDVDLSKKGIEEAKQAGRILRNKGYTFDVAFTSVLIRATRTLDLTLKEMDLKVPIYKSWRLNERHYGDLQGFNKAKMAKKVGFEQVHKWRRSYNVRPPAIKENDERNPRKDPLYKNLKQSELPLTECLKDTVARVLPYWKKEIIPVLKKGKRVIISAHGNSLRALVKYIDNIPDKDIPNLNIPTGIPLVYELNKKLKPVRHYYLGDAKKVKNAIKATANQGKNQKI